MIARAWLGLSVVLTSVACATAGLKLPTGPGTPAPDATVALDQALAACSGIRSFTAELALSGRTGGQKVRGRLAVGLAAPASVYLEAPAPFGAPLFVFAAASDDEATLWLPRDRRALEHGRPADVLDAVAGVPLGPAELRTALTGCAPRRSGNGARRFGDRWLILPGDVDLYLHRDLPAGLWQLVAVTHRHTGSVGAWHVEYDAFQNGLPRLVRLRSADRQRFDLRGELTQVEVNVPLEPATFRPRLPPGLEPVTIDELRGGGPFAGRSSTPRE
jgi:hypothetical protein